MRYLVLIFFVLYECVHADDLQDIHPSIKAKYFSESYGQITYIDPDSGVEKTTKGYSCFDLVICGDLAIIDCGYAVDDFFLFINKNSGELICAHSIWQEKPYADTETDCIPAEYNWETRACN